MASTCKDANILALKAAMASNGNDSCAKLAAAVVTNVVAYNEAASRAHDLNQAADTLRKIASALGAVNHKSTDFDDAFDAWSTTALAADAATASELAAKDLVETSFATWKAAMVKVGAS